MFVWSDSLTVVSCVVSSSLLTCLIQNLYLIFTSLVIGYVWSFKNKVLFLLNEFVIRLYTTFTQQFICTETLLVDCKTAKHVVNVKIFFAFQHLRLKPHL